MTTMEIEIEHFIHLVSGVAITIGTSRTRLDTAHLLPDVAPAT